jgi:hypothetical protein
MEYHAVGVDICEVLLAAARQRCAEAPELTVQPTFYPCDLDFFGPAKGGLNSRYGTVQLPTFVQPVSTYRLSIA